MFAIITSILLRRGVFLAGIYFLIGGARSGKSSYGEKLAKSLSAKVAYIATSKITDEEMEKRISSHRKRRPRIWKTYEIDDENINEEGIKKIIESISKEDINTVIIDCITNLLFRIIYDYKLDSIEVIRNEVERVAEKEVISFFKSFLEELRESRLNVIIVSNEIGMGVVPAFPLGRIFRDLMGIVNKIIAEASDEVYLFIAGLKQRLK